MTITAGRESWWLRSPGSLTHITELLLAVRWDTHEHSVNRGKRKDNKNPIGLCGFFLLLVSIFDWMTKVVRGSSSRPMLKIECCTSTWDPTKYQRQHHESWKATQLDENLYLVDFLVCLNGTSLGEANWLPVRFFYLIIYFFIDV